MTTEEMSALYALCFETSQATWSAESFEGFRKDPNTEIFTHDQGFMIARFVADEAEILTLLVHPEARRQGTASALLDDLLNASRERQIQMIHLEVASDNPGAIAFYENFGFERAGRRKGYYARKTGAPVDAIVMRKRLNPIDL